MSRTLEFWFDIVSPASYLANEQLPALKQKTGAQVVYRPMFLHAVIQATGGMPPFKVAAKGAYFVRDMHRCAARLGVAYQQNPHFPMNTSALQRALLVLSESQDIGPMVTELFRATWAKGQNIADRDTASAAIRAAGVDPASVWAAADAPDARARLDAASQQAVARGVFGAPAMFVGDELFWGQDRVDHAIDALMSVPV